MRKLGWGWKLRSRSLPVDPGAHCSGEQYIFCDFEVIEKGLCKEGEREGDGEREAIGFSLKSYTVEIYLVFLVRWARMPFSLWGSFGLVSRVPTGAGSADPDEWSGEI